MIPIKNLKDKNGNIIPWDTSLLSKNEGMSIRQTERQIEKSEYLPALIKMSNVFDKKNNHINKSIFEHQYSLIKKKRNLLLFVQFRKVKNNLWIFFTNDQRNGRKWIWHRSKILTELNIIEYCNSILRKYNNNIYFLPIDNLIDTFLSLKLDYPNEVFTKVGKNNALFLKSSFYEHIKKNNNPLFKSKNKETIDHLDALESESIHIIREAAAEADNPVMLYSIGKDSAVMLHLAAKAFFPGKIPFPLLHVDTGWKFRQMYEFRDYISKKYETELIVFQNKDGVNQNINPFDHGSIKHTHIMKTVPLLQAIEKYKFDIAFGGARRDEEKSRAKERIFSFRDSAHQWNPKNQRPELWNIYNTKINSNESIRAFPLSNWTELDIWKYIQKEKIEIVPLYFAAYRPLVSRNGTMLMIDDDRLKIEKNESVFIKKIRFRTLGCYPLTGAIESNSINVDEIVEELINLKVSERQGRLIDNDESASMEKKKIEGYF